MSMNDELFEIYKVVASGAITLQRALEEVRALVQDSDFDLHGIEPLAAAATEAARAGHIRSACIQWRIVIRPCTNGYTEAGRGVQ